MQNPNLTHEDLVTSLHKIGIEPSGYLRFRDGLRSIDLSDVTDEDMNMISGLINSLPKDLAEAEQPA
jgi:hypothetical protein